MAEILKETKKIHLVINPSRSKITLRVITIAPLTLTTMFTMILRGTTQNLMMIKMKVVLQPQV